MTRAGAFLKAVLRQWIPIAVALTVLLVTLATAVQQVYRQGANDPQIQMAEDTAAALVQGRTHNLQVSPQEPVEITSSAAPFLMVLDADGRILSSTGQVAGSIPSLPPGVLDYTRAHGQDRVTWQPQPGVRIATVVRWFTSKSGSGFVLAGRSLREVEARVDNLRNIVLAGWLASLAFSLVAVAVVAVLL